VRELAGIYGVRTYTQWGDRLEHKDRQGLRDLSDTKERSRQLATHPAHEVCSGGEMQSAEQRGSVLHRRFPIHSRGSLLPFPAEDALLRDLGASIVYDLDYSGLVSFRRT
jgi:hypothetical protein